MRRLGWIALLIFSIAALLAACGPPEVHDINGGGSGLSDDDDDGVGDDDDDAASTFPTATTPPGAAPTLTKVPSFATWNSTIRTFAPGNCETCHGGSGGVYFDSTPVDSSAAKYLWFTAICNRTSNGDGAGTQDYQPATGRFRAYWCNQASPNGNTHTEASITNRCTQIDAWFAEADPAVTPPDCNTYYDLANSN